jgi:hypothetical protein
MLRGPRASTFSGLTDDKPGGVPEGLNTEESTTNENIAKRHHRQHEKIGWFSWTGLPKKPNNVVSFPGRIFDC